MAHFQARRAFLKFLATGTASMVMPCWACASEKEVSKRTTYTYKTVGKCEIKADVHRASEDKARPVVIWIHGGALIMGNRQGIDRVLLNSLVNAGYVVVSIDYRLAPETKLPGILEDVHDAYRWVREKGPELFHVDAKKVGVLGASAGGYLTLAAGFRLDPRPAALVSFWGYGDIAGAWYSRPDPFYCRLPLVSKEEASKAVGGPVISESSGKNDRHRFYLYCRQQGLWPKEVTAHDPDKEPKVFDPLCPIRNVSKEYPPTLLIHGTKDTDVPYAQSQTMAKELARKSVEHELITIPDGGHGFAGVKPAMVSKTYERVLVFLKKYMR